MTVDITIFSGFAPPNDRHWSLLEEIQPRRVIIGLDDEDDDHRRVDRADYSDQWALRRSWRGDRLVSTIDRLRDMDIEVGVHYWLRPVRLWCEGAHDFIRELCQSHGVGYVIADAEIHYLRMDPVQGDFESLEDYHHWLDNQWRHPPHTDDGFAWWPAYGIAVYGYPNERTTALASLDVVQEIVPMVYGNRRHTGDAPNQPEATYARSAQLWHSRIRPDQRVVMGMGAYDQARPSRSTGAVMRSSARTVLQHGITGLAYWQLRTVKTPEKLAIIDISSWEP